MNRKRTLTVLFGMLIAVTAQAQNRSYDITRYGAKGDSLTINTESIQEAVDKCSSDGGGVVLVPAGVFLTGTVILKSNVTLHLSEGSKLLGSIHIEDYKNPDPFTDAIGQKRGNCLLGAVDAENVNITGKGTIDGRGEAFTRKELKLRNAPENAFVERPFLVRFVRSAGITVSGVNLVRPAAWTLHFFQSKHIKVDGISIYSHVNANNDGIDIDSSTDVTITNCSIDAGDDALCFKTTSPLPCANIYVSDCRLSSNWGAIKFGTESMGDFENITIEKCALYNTRGGGIKILSADGANIRNITISNITMDQVDMPIFIRLGERQRTYRNAPMQPVGTIDGISIRNVRARARTGSDLRVSPSSGIFITGTPGHLVKNVRLENIEILLPGGGSPEMADIIVEETEKAYPEYMFFGVLPAHAIFSRHVDGLYMKNVSIKTVDMDFRPAYVFDDVKNMRIY